MSDLLTLSLQIGGPLFTLAAIVVWLAFRHIGVLTNLMGNHMTHVETALVENTGAQEKVADAVDRLTTVLIQGTNSKE